MHAKSGLRVLLKWKIYRPGSVIADVITLMQNYVAILGFGFQPPQANLILVEQAVALLHTKGLGVAVGNLSGTFATALETADKLGGYSLAIIDMSMLGIERPKSTRIIEVEFDAKHQRIAEYAIAALIIGGGKGTSKLAAHFVALGKPLAAVVGSGGIVDDGGLPKEVVSFAELNASIEYLLRE